MINLLLDTLKRHRYTVISLVGITYGAVSLVDPLAPHSYAEATVIEQLRGNKLSLRRNTSWRVNLDGRTPSIRGVTLLRDVSKGDVICVLYADRWPEGLKVFRQVDDERCS